MKKVSLLPKFLKTWVIDRCLFWYLLAVMAVCLLMDFPKTQTNWLNQKQATMPQLITLEETGKIDRASLNEGYRYFLRWKKINPKEGLLWGAIGTLSYYRGDYSTAEESYQKAIDLDPAIYTHYWDLGMVYFYLGNFKEAVTLLNMSLNQLSFFPALIERLSFSSEKLAIPQEEVIPRIKRIAERAQADRRDAYLHLADLYSRIPDWQTLDRTCKEAFEVVGPNPRLLYFMGLSSFERKEYSQAIEFFSQAINMEPDYIEAYYYRGLSFKEVNKIIPAKLDIQKATELKETGVKERHIKPMPFTLHINSDLLTFKYQGLLLKTAP